MEPTRIHYFYAQNWPLAIWLTAFAVLFAGGAVRILGSTGFSDLRWATVTSIAVVAAMGIIGLLVGFLAAWAVFYSLYGHRAKINGAPFRLGDVVRVLRGRYRDHVARIYEVWEERAQVRVDLGEAARALFDDVFTETEVIKVDNAALQPADKAESKNNFSTKANDG